MNIFKILANGDGSINEPNVSAFLGYLLNPYADHDLRFEFLTRFMEKIGDEGFNPLKYDYEILFEQAFRENGDPKKEKDIIDIVILCLEINNGNQKESIVRNILNSERSLKKVFLIENKIKKNAIKKGQLTKQYIKAKTELNITDDKLHTIYVSPNTNDFIAEFEDPEVGKVVKNKTQIFWNGKESISNTLKEILHEETNAKIEPINDYTKQTIKAFIQFIETDFKSEKQDQKDRKNDGSYTDRYRKLNEEHQIEQKLLTLKNELIKRDSHFNKILSSPNLSSPRFPYLCVTLKDITIKLHAGASSRDSISFLYQADRNVSNSKRKLVEISKKLNSEIKKENYDDAYCRTSDMQIQIPINEYDLIYSKLKSLINTAQNA